MDSRVQWADLLPELLSQIVDCLEDRADIRQFRAVCRSWRSSSSSCRVPPILIPLNHPLKIPFINFPFHLNPPDLAIFSCNIYLLVPCQDRESTTRPVPWLLRLQELNLGKYKLQSALMSHTFPHPNNIDPSGFQVIQLARTYHFSGHRSIYEDKVILFSSLKSNDIATLVLTRIGRVYCVRSSDLWKRIAFEGASWIDDIVLYKGVAYAVDIRGCLYRISKTLQADIVSAPLRGHDFPETRKRLVELNEELYLIREINYKVHVYKLDARSCSWCVINSFGDKILFVGIDCCFFASAEVFPTWRGNGIVFHFSAFESNNCHPLPDLSWYYIRCKYLSCKTVYYTSLEDKMLETVPVEQNVLLRPPASQSRNQDET